MGLRSDGSIVVWGENHWGQRFVPGTNAGFVAIAAGGYHCLALRSDGSVAAWGAGDPGESGWADQGQSVEPIPNEGFTAIAANGYHSMALRSDGSIVAWGYNAYGQCDVPLPNAGFVGLAAGGFHSLGLHGDGSIVAWGANDSGQCDVPEPNEGFSAVSAGGEHSLALKPDALVAAGDAEALPRIALRVLANPFLEGTALRYELSEEGPVDVRILDVQGRVVRALVSGGIVAPGSHTVPWDGRNDSGQRVPSGVYFARMRGGPPAKILAHRAI
ncbi:MAG: FlgD immunoglobulin-like domain containing protein [Candidatus Eisenbacteria bacterium]|nr:FlgD immunoglobulin-like domain containing protein [Candidatus Eisenbacteria bacterium]